MFAIIGFPDQCATAKTPSGKIVPLQRSAGVNPMYPDSATVPIPEYVSRPSSRNILGLDRQTTFGLPKRALQDERVIKVLAIRVEFVKEDTDDPNTTGDGTFDLRDSTLFKAERGHLFDASPHDSAYFGKHLEALHRYWHTVSNGKISIEATIYPPDPTGSYKLPNTMGYYGSRDPLDGLSEFFFDAIRLADTTSPEIDFAAYDSYCIFHAGADRQNDIGFPPTPSDLFTGFILMGQRVTNGPSMYLDDMGLEYAMGTPVPVDNGNHFIYDGLIMPEITAQDNRIVVLNSVLAHEFGHQLGLIDLYKTSNFVSQVGNFSLMDNNAGNIGGEIEVNGQLRLLFGSLPPYPDAWSRAYLGFVSVDTVRALDGLDSGYVAAAELLSAPPQAILVPITDDEYFLLENRRIDIDGDPIVAILADSTTNVILGPVNSEREFSREYDYLLPGNGILIFHVDETVAADDVYPYDDLDNNYIANTLQWEFDRRFCWLVEADMERSFLGDWAMNYGTVTDMFSSPSRRVFTPDTPISSASNSGARTGITIIVDSESDLVMDFRVLNDQALPGFPVWCGADAPYFSPTISDIDSDGSPEIFVGCGNRIVGWHFDGTPLFQNNIVDTVVSFNGDTVTHKVAAVAVAPEPLATPPLFAVMDGIGDINLAVGDSGRGIHMWRVADFDQNGYADEIFSMESENMLSGPAIVLNRPGWESKYIAFGLAPGGILVIQANTLDSLRYLDAGRIEGIAGSSLDSAYYLRHVNPSQWHLRKLTNNPVLAALPADTVFGPLIADINRDGALEVICTGSNGTIWMFDTLLNASPEFPVTLGYDLYSAPVTADIDGDGYLEILATGDNLVFAINYNGTMAEDFPVIVDRDHPTGPLQYSPIVISYPDDQFGELMLVSDDGELISVYPRTFNQPDPPVRPVGRPGLRSPAYAYDANSGVSAVFALGGDGFLYGFKMPETISRRHGAFVQEGYDAARRFVYPNDSLPDIPASGEFLAESSVYAYPNPADGDVVYIRYRLGDEADVAVSIYDVAGNLIEELVGDGLGNTENEIAWQCSDVASGVYFCRLEARSVGGQSIVTFCPVAIAR